MEMTSHWEKTMSRRYKKVRGQWSHPGFLGSFPFASAHALAKFTHPVSRTSGFFSHHPKCPPTPAQ